MEILLTPLQYFYFVADPAPYFFTQPTPTYFFDAPYPDMFFFQGPPSWTPRQLFLSFVSILPSLGTLNGIALVRTPKSVHIGELTSVVDTFCTFHIGQLLQCPE